jgi:hypothetical protein
MVVEGSHEVAGVGLQGANYWVPTYGNSWRKAGYQYLGKQGMSLLAEGAHGMGLVRTTSPVGSICTGYGHYTSRAATQPFQNA